MKFTRMPAVAGAMLAGAMLAATPATADVAGFYQGKTITVVVPGGLGALARPLWPAAGRALDQAHSGQSQRHPAIAAGRRRHQGCGIYL